MVALTPALAGEYASEVNFGTVKRFHKYKGVDKYLQHACNEGGLLKDEILFWVFREQGFDLRDERDNKSKRDVLSLFDSLARYGETRDWNPNQEHLQQAIAKAWSHFGRKSYDEVLKPIDSTSISSVSDAIKLEKSSGFPSFSSKADDLVRACNSHSKWITQVIAGSKKAFLPPCVAYSRVQHGDEGPKTRLVWGYSLEATIAESRYARPLIDKFLTLRSPMAFGLLRFEVGARLQGIVNGGVTYALDYSKFDASINPRLICVAFEILRSWFDLDESEYSIWNAIVRHFIHTPIIMPDGHLYVKHSGIPSGSFFTQLVGSIVNYILVQYCAIHLADFTINRKLVMVLGDDSIFCLPDLIPIERFARLLKTHFGVKVNEGKSGVYTSGSNIHFLGHIWDKLTISRPIDEVAKRLVYPERFESDLSLKELQRTRIAGYCTDGTNVAPLLRQLIFGGHQNVYGVWLNLRISGRPVTGYQEWLDSIGLGDLLDSRDPSSNAAPNVYIGTYR